MTVEKLKERLEHRRKTVILKASKLPLKMRGSIVHYTQEEKKIRLELFKIKYGLIGEFDTPENFERVINGKGFVEFKSCTNKIAYFNALSLEKACKEVSIKTLHKQYGYYCEFCDLFHSTSHPCPHLENINFFKKEN